MQDDIYGSGNLDMVREGDTAEELQITGSMSAGASMIVTDQNQLLLMSEPSGLQFSFLSGDSMQLFLEHADAMGFGTFEWHVAENKVFWSDAIYKIYELDKTDKEIDYEIVKSYTLPDDRKKGGLAIQRALETGEDQVVEVKIRTAKQNIKIIESKIRVKKNEAGEVSKMIGSIRDVTEQRMAEQNLQKHLVELNRSNKELEEFAYVASHDLQEPLRKITTFSDRLSEKYANTLAGDGALYMSRIVASAENMRLLISNLLEFSRVTKANQPFGPINLNFVLKEVKADLELPLAETGTVINSETLPTLEGSLTQLKQLFINIINNAIKFRKPDQQPVINIRAARLNDDDKMQLHLAKAKSYLKITIEDNGIGFDREYARKIFQIFQRLHGKSEYPGSGIGLAICKKIIEHHHGLIYADSEEDHGAVFTLILPESQ